MSVRDAVALEADRDHVTVAGLEAERSRHLDVPAKRIIAELLYPNISNIVLYCDFCGQYLDL